MEMIGTESSGCSSDIRRMKEKRREGIKDKREESTPSASSVPRCKSSLQL